MESQRPERLRQHPEQRFAGSRHQFDLPAEAQKLAGEIAAGQGGHRQQSLYKHGPTSVSHSRSSTRTGRLGAGNRARSGHVARQAPHAVHRASITTLTRGTRAG